MVEKVRFGVIGLGWFGEIHCEVLQGLRNAELIALCTRTESKLNALAGRFGVERAYTDYIDLVADPNVDAVIVTTPWDQHCKPVLAALESGKHVFVEKPLASTVGECQAMIDAADQSDRAFMVGHICRFNPRYVAAKAEIDSGAIGRIVSMYARRNISRRIGEMVLDSIGPIIGDGVHDTDIMLWFTGANIETAFARTLDVNGHRNPDVGWTMYQFDSGAIGVCENVWCLPENAFEIDNRMEIIGTEGAIYIHDTHPNYSVVDKDGWRSPNTTSWPILAGVRQGVLATEMEYFIGCVQEGVKPTVVRPEEALAATRACLAAEASARSGHVVKV